MRDVDLTVRHTVTPLIRPPRPVREDPVGARFALLGPLRVERDGVAVAPPASGKLAQALALLLLRPGNLVHNDSLVHEVWSYDPPADPRTAVQTLVYQLRRYVEDAGLASSGRRLVAGRPSSCALRVDPGQVDVVVFRDLVRHGNEAFRAGQYERAAGLLHSALDLWSGAPLANVTCGPVLSSYVTKLEQEFRTARHLRIQADIEAGRGEPLIGELRRLVRADPLDEGSHAQLMQVLGFAGRRSEALLVYRGLRARLIDELGLEPCETVQEQHDRLLRGGLSAR